MKYHLFILSLLAVSWLLGCGHPREMAIPPPAEKIDPHFRPKRLYFVDFEKAWALTLQLLQAHSSAIAISEKDKGLIETGYFPGQGPWRYRFRIQLSKEAGKTFIQAAGQLETRTAGTQYRDITYNLPWEVLGLEVEFYRKLESFLAPHENPPEQTRLAARELLSGMGDPANAAPSPMREDPLPPTQEKAAPPVIEEISSPSPALAGITPVAAAPAMPSAPPTPHLFARKIFFLTRNANLRERPTTASPILLVCRKGRQIEKIGKTGAWANVKLSWGESGWVLQKMIAPSLAQTQAVIGPVFSGRTSTSPEKPVLTPSPQPPNQVQPPSDLREDRSIWITRQQANMRETPSYASSVIAVLKKGRVVSKVGLTGSWVNVRLPWGDTGWVHQKLLEEDRDQPGRREAL